MRHQRVEEWEAKLNGLLRRVDHALEEQFGSLLRPHPSRPARNSTANPQQDGLFRVTASFTAGYGSELGKGYVVKIDTVTLDPIPASKRAAIEKLALALIREGLDKAMPERKLALKRDGALWKIVGDLSLSTANTRGRAPHHREEPE